MTVGLCRFSRRAIDWDYIYKGIVFRQPEYSQGPAAFYALSDPLHGQV